ncbi:MAG: rRNA maturation RNase YbeY [Hyphomicrobiaceae bacterium]|nr:rRNA maturation RNase YbeY [Hyphomicrobiaceae bacterium]
MTVPGDSSPSTSPVEPAPAEPEPPERLSVTILEEAGDWSQFGACEEAIAGAAAAVARDRRCARARGAEACVVLADDALQRSLNHAYRGRDAPTNVLSFPFQDALGAASRRGSGAAEPRQLGDVVLAAETLRKEAAEQGIPPVHHLQHLVVHGLLHLLGFDHGTEAQAQAMERLEAQILATLGVADPYAAA